MTTDFPFRRTPFRHQLEDWERSRELSAFGLFHEPGCGKSKIVIDSAAWLYRRGQIDALLVVAPNGVHRNWITDECPEHVPEFVDWRGLTWHASQAHTQKALRQAVALMGAPFPVLAVTYDALRTDACRDYVRAFLQKRRAMGALDESTRIKTPGATTTRLALGMADLLPYRRILSGTAVANGPFDAYSQVRFLDYDYWVRAPERPIETYQLFQHRFGVMKRFQPSTETRVNKAGKTVKRRPWEHPVAFKNLDELAALLRPISSRRTKDEVLDLPPKLYTKRYHDLTDAQWAHYQRLKTLFLTELDSGELVTAAFAMTRLLRLQQVVCGYLPSEEEQRTVPLMPPDENPRLRLLDEVVEDTPHQAIIWARFTADIDAILERLNAKGPPRAVRYDGKTSQRDREAALRMFHAGERQFFVANPAAIAMGVTLVEAKTVVYYSNDYSLEKRLQSEDRAHRIGQTRPVLYLDFVASGTVDEHIVRALQKKFGVMGQIMGDRFREWL